MRGSVWTLFVLIAALFPAFAIHASPVTWKAEGWVKTDFGKSNVSFSEIMSGGPPKDGIPPIDAPVFQSISEVKDLTDRDPVIGLVVNGDARAYPLRILIWHEIVNDTVGGKPVAVTYCPLCNSAIVFDRRHKGAVLDFGTTGKLRNSDLVMYDRQSESWWQQFTGEAIVGARTGDSLTAVPARLEAFADFKTRHPDGRVLVPNDPNLRDYGRNPYFGYDTLARPFLYQGDMPDGIEPMARVVVVRPNSDKRPIIVSVARLRKSEYRDGDIVIRWRAGKASALDKRVIAEGRDVGIVEAFRINDNTNDETLLVHDVTFAFAAHAFHPEIAIVK